MNEPIVKGGQGRTEDDCNGGAITWAIVMSALFGIGLIVWAIFRWGG